MKIAIIGKKLVGKSTMARAMAKELKCEMVDTSEAIYERMAEETGTPLADLRKMPKEEIRPQLIEIGDRLSLNDPLAIVRPALGEETVTVAGIRKKDQLELLRKEHPDSVVIWIDRPDHETDAVDNLELDESDADVIFTNDKSLKTFRKDAKEFVKIASEISDTKYMEEPGYVGGEEEDTEDAPFLLVRAIAYPNDESPFKDGADVVPAVRDSIAPIMDVVADLLEGDVVVVDCGAVAISLASVAKPGVEVVCTDRFPAKRGGYCTFSSFLRDVTTRKLNNVITPMPMETGEASLWFQESGIRPALVYVDCTGGDMVNGGAERTVGQWLAAIPERMAGNGMLVENVEARNTIRGITRVKPGTLVTTHDDGFWSWECEELVLKKIEEAAEATREIV